MMDALAVARQFGKSSQTKDSIAGWIHGARRDYKSSNIFLNEFGNTEIKDVIMPIEELGRGEKMPADGNNSRPAIPADLKRKILVEAGHRCAIPTCRHITVEIHHIIPWKERREHEYDNLIALCPNCHNFADRGKIDIKSLRMYKLNLRTVHDKFSQLEIDVLFEANKNGEDQAIQWPPFMNILIKRICEAGLVRLSPGGGSVFVFGMQISPMGLTITREGRDYIQQMSEEEM